MFSTWQKKMMDCVFPARNHLPSFGVIFSAFPRIVVTTVDSNVDMMASKDLSQCSIAECHLVPSSHSGQIEYCNGHIKCTKVLHVS